MTLPSAQPATTGHSNESALHDLLTSLRRRAGIIVVVVMAITAGAVAYSVTAEKQYTATAKLLFRDPGFDQRLFGGQALAPSVDPAREAATNVGLASLDTVAQRAADNITGRRITADQVRDKVTVAAQGQSNVVAVKATDPSPEFAAKLANTVASQYIVFRRDADRRKIRQAADLVRGQLAAMSEQQRAGAEGRSLRKQVEQLGVLAALQTGNAERVQPARTPDTPSSPKLVRNLILALILGLGLGLGVALLRDRLDQRLHALDDIKDLFGRPVLGVIPESRSLRTDRGGALHLSGQEAEAFRAMRANLRYYNVDRKVRSLVVTSSAPGDGKSTVARYLAATTAAAGARVVLLEADLRRPTLNALYPSLRTPGLSDVLSDQVSLAQSIQKLPVEVTGALSGRTLDVIVAGTLPPNPTDLLESDHMRRVIAGLEKHYDLVVIDSSPVTIVPDSIPVLAQVSGVLVVVREAKSTGGDARALRDQLSHLGIVPLGLVMNGTPLNENEAYYGYYLYAPADAPQPASNGTRPDEAPAAGRRGSRRHKREEAGAPES